MSVTTVPDSAELEQISARLEVGPAGDAVRWAVETFGDGLVLAASFQDCVLIDIATKVVPDVDVAFLDTQYHFSETLEFVETVRDRYDLNLRVLQPTAQPDELWKTDTDACCAVRKVETLRRALDGKLAWMSGLRRCEAPSRADAPVVSWDVARGLVKVNPIVTWSDDDVAAYSAAHDLPEHPLSSAGYTSIGCWPCTKPVTNGGDARAGRWADSDKLECGLHL